MKSWVLLIKTICVEALKSMCAHLPLSNRIAYYLVPHLKNLYNKNSMRKDNVLCHICLFGQSEVELLNSELLDYEPEMKLKNLSAQCWF